MLEVAKSTMRDLASRLGVRVLRLQNDPEHGMCGLRRMSIRTVLDVGANRGASVLYYAPLFPDARIISFEPQPAAFQELKALEKRLGSRLTSFNLALGEKAGTAPMHLHVDHDTSSSLLPTTETARQIYPFVERQGTIEVEVARLDDVLAGLEHPLEPEILLKLDVQGFELQVLAGGPATLRAVAAAVVEVSLAPLYHGQPTFVDVVTTMAEVGMRFGGCLHQYLDEDGRVIFVDAVFRRRSVVDA